MKILLSELQLPQFEKINLLITHLPQEEERKHYPFLHTLPKLTQPKQTMQNFIHHIITQKHQSNFQNPCQTPQ